jgi:hypothetical protein
MFVSAEISPEHDLAAIAAAAGNGNQEDRYYSEGRLYVRGVTLGALEAAVAAPPPPTPEQMQAAYTDAIKAHVEATAQARGYSSALSCASYAGSTVPAWRAEGAAFMIWRDDVWEAALAMLAAVQAGGAIPESPIAGLPEMEWP